MVVIIKDNQKGEFSNKVISKIAGQNVKPREPMPVKTIVENILDNPSFDEGEIVDTGKTVLFPLALGGGGGKREYKVYDLPGWLIFAPKVADHKVELINDPYTVDYQSLYARSKKALKLTSHEIPQTGGLFYIISKSAFKLNPGSRIWLRGFIKGHMPELALQLIGLDSDGNIIKFIPITGEWYADVSGYGYYNGIEVDTDTYQELSYSKFVNEEFDSFMLALIPVVPITSGVYTITFDDLSLFVTPFNSVDINPQPVIKTYKWDDFNSNNPEYIVLNSYKKDVVIDASVYEHPFKMIVETTQGGGEWAGAHERVFYSTRMDNFSYYRIFKVLHVFGNVAFKFVTDSTDNLTLHVNFKQV